MLGNAGRKYWESTVHHYHEQAPYTLENLPPNKIIIPVCGQLTDVWIPKQYWIDFCKALGISFIQEEYQMESDWNPLDIKDGSSYPAGS